MCGEIAQCVISSGDRAAVEFMKGQLCGEQNELLRLAVNLVALWLLYVHKYLCKLEFHLGHLVLKADGRDNEFDLFLAIVLWGMQGHRTNFVIKWNKTNH